MSQKTKFTDNKKKSHKDPNKSKEATVNPIPMKNTDFESSIENIKPFDNQNKLSKVIITPAKNHTKYNKPSTSNNSNLKCVHDNFEDSKTSKSNFSSGALKRYLDYQRFLKKYYTSSNMKISKDDARRKPCSNVKDLKPCEKTIHPYVNNKKTEDPKQERIKKGDEVKECTKTSQNKQELKRKLSENKIDSCERSHSRTEKKKRTEENKEKSTSTSVSKEENVNIKLTKQECQKKKKESCERQATVLHNKTREKDKNSPQTSEHSKYKKQSRDKTFDSSKHKSQESNRKSSNSPKEESERKPSSNLKGETDRNPSRNQKQESDRKSSSNLKEEFDRKLPGNPKESCRNIPSNPKESRRKLTSNPKEKSHKKSSNNSEIKNTGNEIKNKTNKMQKAGEKRKHIKVDQEGSQKSHSPINPSKKNESKRRRETPAYDNLVVTVTQDVKHKSSKAVKGNSKHKPKVEKSQQIKLVINVKCRNSPISEEILNESCSSPQQDLSFLDDIDIDGIVDSLNASKSPIRESQDVEEKNNSCHDFCNMDKCYLQNAGCNEGCIANVCKEKITPEFDDDVYEVIDITEDNPNDIILLEDVIQDAPEFCINNDLRDEVKCNESKSIVVLETTEGMHKVVKEHIYISDDSLDDIQFYHESKPLIATEGKQTVINGTEVLKLKHSCTQGVKTSTQNRTAKEEDVPIKFEEQEESQSTSTLHSDKQLSNSISMTSSNIKNEPVVKSEDSQITGADKISSNIKSEPVVKSEILQINLPLSSTLNSIENTSQYIKNEKCDNPSVPNNQNQTIKKEHNSTNVPIAKTLESTNFETVIANLSSASVNSATDKIAENQIIIKSETYDVSVQSFSVNSNINNENKYTEDTNIVKDENLSSDSNEIFNNKHTAHNNKVPAKETINTTHDKIHNRNADHKATNSDADNNIVPAKEPLNTTHYKMENNQIHYPNVKDDNVPTNSDADKNIVKTYDKIGHYQIHNPNEGDNVTNSDADDNIVPAKEPLNTIDKIEHDQIRNQNVKNVNVQKNLDADKNIAPTKVSENTTHNKIETNQIQNSNVEDENVPTNSNHKISSIDENKKFKTNKITSKSNIPNITKIDNLAKTPSIKSEGKVVVSDISKKYWNSIEERMLVYTRKTYKITEFIHEGYFSSIYKCKNSNGKCFAIKILKSRYRSISIYKDKMLTSIQKNENKNKCFLLKMINSFDLNCEWCFLSEYYPTTVAEALNHNGTVKSFHIDTVQNLSRQLVEAVAVLTQNQLIHTDIKPSHILLNHSHDRLKLCGFDRMDYFYNIQIRPCTGTTNYRAPEIILGFNADYKIDVWSTALVMFEMVAGRAFFHGRYNNHVLFKQLRSFGPIDLDLIQASTYGFMHFFGARFMRQTDSKNWVFADHLLNRNNKLHTVPFISYKKNWAPRRSQLQVTEDLDKIEMLLNLLDEMLVMDPRHRLPITYVAASEFLYHSDVIPF